MQVGKFGAKIFEVSSKKILTFEGLSLSTSLSTTSEEAAQGKKPATKVKSPGLAKVSMALMLRAALGVDVQAELDAWQSICDTGAPYPLIICGKAVSVNKFLLTSCKADELEIYPLKGKAVLGAAKLTLDFLEFLPPGMQPVATGKGAASAPAAGNAAVQINNAYNAPSAAEKATMKRAHAMMVRGR